MNSFGGSGTSNVHVMFIGRSPETSSADVMRTGQSWAGAFPVRIKDGGTRLVEFRNMRLLDDQGDVYALGLAADRTTVRRLEQDVALSERIVNQSPIGLAVLDTELRYVSVNPALAKINGIQIHYQTKGSGPDVILLHGVTSSLALWYGGVLTELAKHYRVTAYDLRGHGLSEITPTKRSPSRRWSRRTKRSSFRRLQTGEESAVYGNSSTIDRGSPSRSDRARSERESTSTVPEAVGLRSS